MTPQATGFVAALLLEFGNRHRYAPVSDSKSSEIVPTSRFGHRSQTENEPTETKETFSSIVSVHEKFECFRLLLQGHLWLLSAQSANNNCDTNLLILNV